MIRALIRMTKSVFYTVNLRSGFGFKLIGQAKANLSSLLVVTLLDQVLLVRDVP